MSEWKQSINTFAATIGVFLTLVVLDLSLIPYLTTFTASLVVVVNILGLVVLIVMIVWFWRQRLIDFEEAEQIALKDMKEGKFRNAKISRTGRGQLVGRTWHVFVKRETAMGVPATHEVLVDARRKTVESAELFDWRSI